MGRRKAGIMNATLQVMGRYGIEITRIEPGDEGSTNANLILNSVAGRFFLRRYSKPREAGWNRIIRTRETIRYEHDVMRYAAQHGIPCIPPIENIEGDTVTEHDGRFYALFPYIATEPLRPSGAKGIEEARLLAKYHNVMLHYPVTRQRPGWGYAGRLPDWFHENQIGIGTVDEILDWLDELSPVDEVSDYLRRNAPHIRDAVAMLGDEFPEDVYRTCPIVVNHGDYIFKNIGVTDGRLILFDFDFCVRDLRVYDLSMLLGYTAGEAHTARDIDARVARRIVGTYREFADLSTEELRLVPYMLIAFRLRIFLGNLGILRSTSGYPLLLIRRNLEGIRWLMEHRRDISRMLI
jgi:Ser/Thr protein kinase RdoA (MazF antagonist)